MDILTGNMVAVLYCLLFQLCGLLIAWRVLKTEYLVVRLLGGSVLGSVLLHWLPILFAIGVDFTRTAHICAVVAAVTAVGCTWVLIRPAAMPAPKAPVQFGWGILPCAVWVLFACLVYSGLEFRDGAV